MGVDFFLACEQCQVFIDLHKWRLIDSASRTLVGSYVAENDVLGRPEGSSEFSQALYDLDTLCHKVHLQPAAVSQAVESCQSKQEYIGELLPAVRACAVEHADHGLFLTCDVGDLPWDVGEEGFENWKEIPAAFYHAVYLPRNLIEVHQLTRWEEVVALLREKCSWLLDPSLEEELDAVREAFEDRVGEGKESPEHGGTMAS